MGAGRLWAGLLGLVALAAYTHLAGRAAERRRPPPGQRLVLPDGPLHALQAGGGPEVVLIHGSDGVMHDWPLCPLWAPLTARVRAVAYDRPGHGYTPVPPGETVTLDLNVRLLRQMLSALGLRRPVLLAHSYGASVALLYALKYPDKVGGLLLFSPTAYPAPRMTNPLARLIEWAPLRFILLHWLLLPVGRVMVELEGRRAFHPAPIPDAWRRLMLHLSRRASQVLALAQENRTIGAELAGLSEAYGRLRVPVTVVAGDQDQLTPDHLHALPLARALPGARLVRVPGGGHQLHWTHPEVLLAALDQLLRPTFALAED